MHVFTRIIELKTQGQGDTQDLTKRVAAALNDSGRHRGVATVFVVGSTAAITTIEFEPGAVADFNGLMDELAPRAADYRHHERWGDDNGSSHVRAALLGPSISIPFTNGSLMLGTWQQVVLVEFDTSARERQVVVQIMGE